MDGSCDYGSAAVEFDEIESETYGGRTNGSAKKKAKKTRMTYGPDDGLEAFREHMRDADLASISLEGERLHFERDMDDRSRGSMRRSASSDRRKEWMDEESSARSALNSKSMR